MKPFLITAAVILLSTVVTSCENSSVTELEEKNAKLQVEVDSLRAVLEKNEQVAREALEKASRALERARNEALEADSIARASESLE